MMPVSGSFVMDLRNPNEQEKNEEKNSGVRNSGETAWLVQLSNRFVGTFRVSVYYREWSVYGRY